MAQTELTNLNGLTDLENKFVDEYLLNGGVGSRAAEVAGYAKNSARQEAYRLLQKEHIQKALAERGRNAFEAIMSKCIHVIEDALDDDELSKERKAQLALKTMDKSKTFAPTASVKVDHNHKHKHELVDLVAIQKRINDRERAKLIDITPEDDTGNIVPLEEMDYDSVPADGTDKDIVICESDSVDVETAELIEPIPDQPNPPDNPGENNEDSSD